jgi:glycosyltransferase involved in cell wall biosynthesis
MKIAYIGQKGIPATWGGVESHVEELSTRLAGMGHDVDVYVRNWYTPKNLKIYKNVNLKHVPCLHTKYTDATTHSFLSSINSIFSNYDIVHYHAIGPAFFCWIPRITRHKIVVTIHRFDYEASKWGYLAKKLLKISEKISLKIPGETIVVAKYQQAYYKNSGKKTILIANGVNINEKIMPLEIKEKFGLGSNGYILYLGRLVPEKRCDWLIKAFSEIEKESGTNIKLVIAGDSIVDDSYIKMLKTLAKSSNGNILFTGFVSGNLKAELLSNAFLFVLPSCLEGLPIAVLEASSYGVPSLASNLPPLEELIKNNLDGFLFDKNNYEDLKLKLSAILKMPHQNMSDIGSCAMKKVKELYGWDTIAKKTEDLYLKLLKQP